MGECGWDECGREGYRAYVASPGVCDLHLGIDGAAEGGRDRA